MAEIRKVSKYGVLLTKREVKMARYLAKFVLRFKVYGPRRNQGPNTQK